MERSFPGLEIQSGDNGGDKKKGPVWGAPTPEAKMVNTALANRAHILYIGRNLSGLE